ncbi:MAG TPA: hypothetical protein VNW30_09640 [Opitutaceae bacterium]|nr:hypothetical protein [Opitutaceae bacterium]
MYTQPIQHPEGHSHKISRDPGDFLHGERDEFIDLRDLARRIGRGFAQSLGLAMLGLVMGAIAYFATNSGLPVSTSTRVAFAFSGFEKGEYPDHSKFQPDDLRAPAIISEALSRLGLENTEGFQSQIRGALDIEGVIPPEIIKERDRVRATGQVPPTYIPDEYSIVLTLPRSFPLSNQQRGLLLGQIVSLFRENFGHTYADFPSSLGNAFSALHNADFPDYELILNQDLQNITAYLEQRAELSGAAHSQSRTFRSPTTHLSFSDLLEQTRFFTGVRLNDTLSIIYLHGLARDRPAAIEKMDYQLRSLEDELSKASEEETVVQNLLARAQERSHDNYVLDVKSQPSQTRPDSPVLDQGLIDSLIANDSYNFLLHEALSAGLKVKDIQAEKAVLLERHKRLEALPAENDTMTQENLISLVEKSLVGLESAYQELVDNIRKTNEDFSRQQFADAIRLSDAIRTNGTRRSMYISCAAGFLLGLAAGMGLSLLGVYLGSAKPS